jgi:hypothetical protein
MDCAPAAPVLRPGKADVDHLAGFLNAASGVTLFRGAGCAGAHAEVIELARKLKAPIVHAFRGKEFIEYDNPYDVGMTGLVGFASGLRRDEESRRSRRRDLHLRCRNADHLDGALSESQRQAAHHVRLHGVVSHHLSRQSSGDPAIRSKPAAANSSVRE